MNLTSHINASRQMGTGLRSYTAADVARYAQMGGFEGANGLVGAEGGGVHTRADAIVPVNGTAVTVDGQPLSEIWDEINLRNSLFNEHVNSLVSLFVFETTRAQEKVSVYDTARFEEATEFGRPNKVRSRLIARGFPLTHHDLAYGYSQEFIDSARSSQLLAVQGKVESAYWTEQLDTIMSAIFTEANATDADGISVKRLYNADGEVPPTYKRWSHLSTHTHYLTSGAASFDNDDLLALEEHLLHHGYGDNGETLVLMVNRAELVTIRGLAQYVPAEAATVPVIVNGVVTGTRRSAPDGLTPEGYIGEFVVVQNNMIPAGYLMAFATGGTFASENVVGLRVHENPSVRGLRLVEGPNGRYPIIDSVYDTYLGAGVASRGAAAVMQVTAGAYTAPTFP